jgi:3',5'-nucleoside bisphosphate phosphatase
MSAYVDLHTHTTYSDGILTPEQLLLKASKKGFAAISITDHDSIDGCLEAHELSKEYGIEIIDGIEFSCYEDGKEYHILGYNFDPANKDLLKYLDEFRKARLVRAEKIVNKLNAVGFNIHFDEVLDKAGKAPVARPHIASLMLEKNFVDTFKEAFWSYLVEGKPAYEPKANFTISQALKVLNKAGGVAILAHPGKYVTQEELSKIIKLGIDGIETIHPSHDKSTISFLKKIVSQYWLLGTGGSDFHGNREYDEENFGKFKVPYSIVNSIKYHSVRR